MIFFIQQIFGNGVISEIPGMLHLRQNNLTHIVIPLVVISFIIITFAKFQNHSIFYSLFKLVFANKNFEQIFKEDLKILSSSSIALIINYFLIISTCVYLSLQTKLGNKVENPLLISLAIPFCIFILQIVSLWVIGLVTKEIKVVIAPVLQTTVIIEIIGFLLFFLALIWVLNPQHSEYFLLTFVILLIIGFVVRFIKSLFAVLRKGVSWYYIILYFCTLEILPLYVAYYYGIEKFQ